MSRAIDVTPKWIGIVERLFVWARIGKPAVREVAEAELRRMARIADLAQEACLVCDAIVTLDQNEDSETGPRTVPAELAERARAIRERAIALNKEAACSKE